ncbi:thymic stromal lymphopoietin, partial [Glossophaga mutica]
GTRFPNSLPDALLFVLSVFFRMIFILQLVGLVLSYNFRDCDFERIRKDYENIIFEDLKLYVNGTTCTQCKSCDSQVSGRAVILAFSRETPSIPGKGCPAVVRTPGSGWAFWRRRQSRDDCATGTSGSVPSLGCHFCSYLRRGSLSRNQAGFRKRLPGSPAPTGGKAVSRGPAFWAERAAAQVLSPAALSATFLTTLLPRLPWGLYPCPHPRPPFSYSHPIFCAPPCHCPLPVSLISDQLFLVLFCFVLFCFVLFCFVLIYPTPGVMSLFRKLCRCEQPGCLTEIESLTFTPLCKSLAKKTFAVKTNATLTQECPGYSGTQINNTQAMKRRKKREDTKHTCLEIASNLIGLWGRFTRS